MVDLARRLERLEKKMDKIMELLQNERSGEHSQEVATVKAEGESMANGVNVMRIPSRDAYAFGLQVMDILFSKEELSISLLFKSKKSEKPGLESDRVAKLLGFIDKKYGDTWDLKKFTAKANQKCRDTKS